MSVWHSRIVDEGYLDSPAYGHPSVAEAAPVTPMTMPLAMVNYAGEDVLYGTVQPLVTADGAVISAWADVPYPSPIPAGRA